MTKRGPAVWVCPCTQAILAKQRAETISAVLYPDDRTYQVRARGIIPVSLAPSDPYVTFGPVCFSSTLSLSPIALTRS